jgi:peroxiredoxin
MVRTLSTMLPLGTKAPDFALPDTTGVVVSRESLEGASGLLVMFLSNHCPYVKHIREELAALGMDYAPRGVAIVGINANDVEKYPDDSPEKMVEEAREAGYGFPYLFDESQEVAKAYKAACTPDFFLFDQNQALVYRGQLDESRPGSEIPVTGEDLRRAIDTLLGEGGLVAEQRPSMGCNIKWKAGNEPAYFG